WRCCLLRCMSPLMADIVAKRFFASRRTLQIQAARPLDSKVAHLEGAADFCNKIGTKRTIAAPQHFVRYWSNSGQRWISARDGLSANDPQRKWIVHRSTKSRYPRPNCAVAAGLKR